MPRRKSDTGRKIGNCSEEAITRGILLIRNGTSMRKASKEVKVPFATLKRYYWKTKDAASLEGQRLQPNYSINKVFTTAQEKELSTYINYCAGLFYGLTSKECRKLAYQCAQINKLKMPESWHKNEMAGKDWLISFKRRHNLTTRRPEACSLARATSFNEKNVETFFDNLENLTKRNPAFADGTRVFNLDETSTTTVQKPQKVVAPKGRKSIGKVTSGERGTLVTTCCIISASGNALPPVMVFPRKNFKDHMIKNTPPGTLGLATPTGWMNNTIFPEVIKHFIKHTNASKDNPCILIMDNHESHLCLEALNLAKDAGVHILTLHPHTSAKLQPLDVGIYGPFKTYYNAAIDSWLMRHPGKPVTIYDLGEIIGIAFQKAMTPINITKSFAKCGIYPFDRLIFTELDYLPSTVTDRPCPDCAPREEGFPFPAPIVHENHPQPSQSNVTASNEMPGTSFSHTQSNEPETDRPQSSQSNMTTSNEMPGTSQFSHTRLNEPETDRPQSSQSNMTNMTPGTSFSHSQSISVPETNHPKLSQSNITNLQEMIRTTKDTVSLYLHEPIAAKSDNDLNTADSFNLNETTKSVNDSKPATLQVHAFQVISRLLSKSPINFPRVDDATDTVSSEKLQPSHQEPRASENEVPSFETCTITPPRLPLSNLTDELINSQVAQPQTDLFISPFAFRNPIKAGPRSTNRKRRKAGRSLIATDTPEKLLIENEKRADKQKQVKKNVRQVLQGHEEDDLTDSKEKSAVKQKKVANKRRTVRKVLQSDEEDGEIKSTESKEKSAVKQKPVAKNKRTIRKVLASDEEEKDRVAKKQKTTRVILQSDDEEEEDIDIKLTDSEEYSDEADYDQDGDENEIFVLTENHLTKPLPRPACEGEYVIVQFVTKRLRSLYIGKVLEGRNYKLEYYISFLKRKPGTDKFHVPDKPDLSIVKENDIKYILPKPSMIGTSSRPMYYFPFDMAPLKLR